jgi:quinolinate synthase
LAEVTRFNPIRFVLEGLCEEHYQVKINHLQHLKACIRDAVVMVTPNMLQAMWNEIKHCMDICCASKAAHIEIY